MRKQVNIIFVISIILLPLLNLAQDVKFSASSKSVVRVGDQFQMVFTLTASGKDFRGPVFRDFDILAGPNPSSSTNVQIINGKVSRSVTTSYTYYLRAKKEGDFTISSATVKVNGKEYLSNAIKINVVKGTTSANPRSGQPPGTDQGQPTVTSEDVFLRTFVNKTDPYVGEQVIVTYKIFTRVPIPQYGIAKHPSFNGFWTQDLNDMNDKLKQYDEIINNQQYIVAELKKVAVFPIKSGKLTIQPLEIDAIAQIRQQRTSRNNVDPLFDSFFNDPFFGSSYQNVEKHLSSNPIEINAKPLPLENKPAKFGGAVGSFSLKSNIDKTSVTTNEAINLKFTLWGKGNIKLIDVLNITFPPDFEVYDPKVSSKINKNNDGVSGAKTFEYLLIPRSAGNFRLPVLRFNYFEPTQEKYITLQTSEYIINVEKGDETSGGVAYSGITQEDIQYIGIDIHHIKTPPFILQKTGLFFFASKTYFLLLGIPIIIIIIIMILWNYRRKRRSDILLVKTRRATKVARRRLKTAHDYMKNGNEREFFNEVSQALWGYLSDKFNIPLSELSMESVKDALLLKQVGEEIIDEFLNTLNNCEYARFAPGDKTQNMNKIYNEALDIISKIESELK